MDNRLILNGAEYRLSAQSACGKQNKGSDEDGAKRTRG
jgi:hypothetical protein